MRLIDPIYPLLRRLRHDKGWSLDAAAVHTGIPAVVIGAYERADRHITVDRARLILNSYQHDLRAIAPDEMVLPTGDHPDARTWAEWLVVLPIDFPREVREIACASEEIARERAALIPGAFPAYRVHAVSDVQAADDWKAIVQPEAASPLTDQICAQAVRHG